MFNATSSRALGNDEADSNNNNAKVYVSDVGGVIGEAPSCLSVHSVERPQLDYYRLKRCFSRFLVHSTSTF